MDKKYYLLLGLILVLFLGFNFFVYTTPFKVKMEEVKITKKIVKKYPSVLNFGDVMFDRGVRNIMDNRGRDPFEYIKKDLSTINKFDIVVANLEGPIIEIDRSKCQTKEYNFQFASTTPDLLKSVGINMVNIANNHRYDCYSAGFESTKQYLKEKEVDYVGDIPLEKSYVVKNIDGKNIAFVGIDDTVPGISTSDFYSLVKKLDSENDFVVVDIHWGIEYALQATTTQIDIAHNLIDNGADVIFGHHPHVLEPVEIYKNKTIFYSLGNFVFDQNSSDTTVGIGAGVEFQDDKSVFTILPFNLKTFAPDFMKDEEKNTFCDKFLRNVDHKECAFTLQTL